MPDAGGTGNSRRGKIGDALSSPQLESMQMAKSSPVEFFKEVRQEVNKVTWPSRRETTITTIMVFIFAIIAGIFFLAADQLIRVTVTFLLGIGS